MFNPRGAQRHRKAHPRRWARSPIRCRRRPSRRCCPPRPEAVCVPGEQRSRAPLGPARSETPRRRRRCGTRGARVRARRRERSRGHGPSRECALCESKANEAQALHRTVTGQPWVAQVKRVEMTKSCRRTTTEVLVVRRRAFCWSAVRMALTAHGSTLANCVAHLKTLHGGGMRLCVRGPCVSPVSTAY